MHEGYRDATLLHLLEQAAKRFELQFRVTGIVPVAVGEMSHESFDAEGFPSRKRVKQGRELGRRESQAPHSGIHFDMDRKRVSPSRRSFRQGRKQTLLRNDRSEAVRDELRCVLIEQVDEYEDVGVDAGLP